MSIESDILVDSFKYYICCPLFSVGYCVSNYTSARYKLGLCDYFSHIVAVVPFVNGLCHPNFVAFPKCTLRTLSLLSRINIIHGQNFFPVFFGLTLNSTTDYLRHLTQLSQKEVYCHVYILTWPTSRHITLILTFWPYESSKKIKHCRVTKNQFECK